MPVPTGGNCEKYKCYKVFEGFCLFYSNLANTQLSTIKEGENVKVRQRSKLQTYRLNLKHIGYDF